MVEKATLLRDYGDVAGEFQRCSPWGGVSKFGLASIYFMLVMIAVAYAVIAAIFYARLTV